MTNIKILKESISLYNNYDSTITSKIQEINQETQRIKNKYNELNKDYKNKLLIYCFDSINFNTNVFMYMNKHVKEYKNFVYNRIYCDLYRVYKFLRHFISNNVEDEKILSKITTDKFPKYNSLLVFEEYGYETINNIFYVIIELLVDLDEIVKTKFVSNTVFENDNIDINNYFGIFNENVSFELNNIGLIINFTIFLTKLHDKYLMMLVDKIDFCISQLEHYGSNKVNMKEFIDETLSDITQESSNLDIEYSDDEK